MLRSFLNLLKSKGFPKSELPVPEPIYELTPTKASIRGCRTGNTFPTLNSGIATNLFSNLVGTAKNWNRVELNFSHLRIDRHVGTLVPMLRTHCDRIRKISITDCVIDDDGARTLCNLLQPDPQYLQPGLRCLQPGLPQLEEILLAENELHDTLFRRFIPLLRNPKLKRFHYINNKVRRIPFDSRRWIGRDDDYNGVMNSWGQPEKFGTILTQHPSLDELHIQGVPFRTEGCDLLAKALRSNTHLKSLTLIDAEISAEGAGDFLKALKTNTTLQYLNLTNNYIHHNNGFHVRYADGAGILAAIEATLQPRRNRLVEGMPTTIPPPPTSTPKWTY